MAKSPEDRYTDMVNAGYRMATAFRACAVSRQMLANVLVRISKGNHRCRTTGQLAAWMQAEAVAGLAELEERHPDLPMFTEDDVDD